VLEVPVAPSLVALVRVLLATHLPLQQTVSLSADEGSPPEQGPLVPESVRAFAFVVLGKVCLVDQRLAKECVTLLVREIDHWQRDDGGDGCPAVQSNALLVLGDLCVRYTSMVERHLPALARCLQSPHALLRRHALLLLSQLLLQDYLKWRGLLLHRFLLCTVDPDGEVAALARFLVTGPLAQKQPTLLNQVCVDLLFVLNGYEEHPKYQAALLHGSEGAGAVDFLGCECDYPVSTEDAGKNRQHELFRFVCGSLSDEQRIETTARIALEVLSPAAQGMLPCDLSAATSPSSGSKKSAAGAEAAGTFSPEQHRLGFAVLRDALFVLRCAEMKVGRGVRNGDVTEEEMATAAANGHVAAAAAAGLEAAKDRLLSKMSRKQLMEHVVPIVLGLKRRLEEWHSPLLKDLMAFLAELAKSYRGEVKAALSVLDPVLSKELEYDLKMFEKQQKQLHMQQAEEATSAATKGSLVSPRRTVVGFASPTRLKHEPSSRLKSKGKSAVKSGSRAGAVLTPKLRLANTPRSEQETRTPSVAVSAALNVKYREDASHGIVGTGQHDEEAGDIGMIMAGGVSGCDENRAHGLSPVPFSLKQKSKHEAQPFQSPKVASAPFGSHPLATDSLQATNRAPMHRTPHDSTKKKKRSTTRA